MSKQASIQTDIGPKALVIVFDEDAEQPIQLGLVIKITTGGAFDIQVGPEKIERRLVTPEKIYNLIQTDGSFSDPKTAFAHYRDDLVLMAIIAINATKEYQALKRLKERQQKLNRNFRHRFGRGLASLLGKIPFVGKNKA